MTIMQVHIPLQAMPEQPLEKLVADLRILYDKELNSLLC